eukprot:TRINITY_DN220_c0_g1_i1.p1 TRINITY_DN220_c0_g1~~TRINITY_DN220_c0_g1_i1.p1  ORF type:complete len:139 (-),score=27.73 TRINITY_DN220_c0_g1_i1:381-797(-)
MEQPTQTFDEESHHQSQHHHHNKKEHHHHHQHSHGQEECDTQYANAEKWAARFDNPDRDSEQKPDLILKAAGIKPESLSADIGGGTGYFPIKIAQASPQGRVYSCDLSPQMIDYQKRRYAENNITNIIPILVCHLERC